MTNLRYAVFSALAVAVLATPAAPIAAPTPGEKPPKACFLSHDWDGWSAPGDGDALYLRVHIRDVYRVDLTPGSHVHKYPDYFLINRVRGSSWICDPLDLDLSVSDHNGFRQPLIARSLRKLTPAEVAAIPRKDLP